MWAECPRCAGLLFGTVCTTVAMTWSLLPRGEDTRSPHEPTQQLLRTKPKGPGREGRQLGRLGDGQGLDEDMASGLRADRWPDRGYGTCKLREAGTNGPECCVAGREGNDRRRRQGQGAAGAWGSRAGRGPRAFLWEDGSHQWLTARVVRCPSLLKGSLATLWTKDGRGARTEAKRRVRRRR